MYNKTIIRFGFCDIQNNQGLGKGYQPQTLIILDITKTSSITVYNVYLGLLDHLGSFSYSFFEIIRNIPNYNVNKRNCGAASVGSITR